MPLLIYRYIQKFDAVASNPNDKGFSGHEQSGVVGAKEELLDQLAALNDEYYQKNNFVFLICATGKTIDQMISALESRLSNTTEQEVNK